MTEKPKAHRKEASKQQFTTSNMTEVLEKEKRRNCFKLFSAIVICATAASTLPSCQLTVVRGQSWKGGYPLARKRQLLDKSPGMIT